MDPTGNPIMLPVYDTPLCAEELETESLPTAGQISPPPLRRGIASAETSLSAIDFSSPPPPARALGYLGTRIEKNQIGIDIDAIHEAPLSSSMAPAQLYSTTSGRLYHAGKILVVTVGLPARGKTHIAVAMTRYLRWMGVKTQPFHLGDYRRKVLGPGAELPEDYFFVKAGASTVKLRQKVVAACKEDVYRFLEQEGGQVAIYDAVNPLSGGRINLKKEFEKRGIQTLFIESLCNDQRLIEENVRNVKISSPDYIGWDPDAAVKDYLYRINSKIPHFETMTRDENLNYIKMVNAGENLEINNCRMIGYLLNRIVFYLMNLHIKTHVTYFVRAGECREEDLFRTDSELSDDGVEYAQKMTKALLAHRKKEHDTFIAQGGSPDALKPLTIWTSTRRRTVETAQYFPEGYKRKQRPQLSQLNPGDLEGATIEDITKKYPEEAIKHSADPYHHRYPRAESYHDLAQRLEPIILELEREKSDLLIIAHESVLRVLYGYLMASRTEDIPFLNFTRDEIVEIIPASYQNVARRINIVETIAEIDASGTC